MTVLKVTVYCRTQTDMSTLIPMCWQCLHSYGIPLPAMKLFDATCECCGKHFITVHYLSGTALDLFNDSERGNANEG